MTVKGDVEERTSKKREMVEEVMREKGERKQKWVDGAG